MTTTPSDDSKAPDPQRPEDFLSSLAAELCAATEFDASMASILARRILTNLSPTNGVAVALSEIEKLASNRADGIADNAATNS